jgi:Lipocalin-like domain
MLLRLIALMCCLLAVQAVVADDRAKLLGNWKLVAWVQEFQDGGEQRPEYGKHPLGYLIFTPEGRMMALLEGEGRKSPSNDQERAALFRSMIAYTGRYYLDGDKWTTRVDAAWHPDRRGADQVRYFKVEGDKLTVTTPFMPSPNFGGRVLRSVLVWEREK